MLDRQQASLISPFARQNRFSYFEPQPLAPGLRLFCARGPGVAGKYPLHHRLEGSANAVVKSYTERLTAGSMADPNSTTSPESPADRVLGYVVIVSVRDLSP